MTFLQGGGFGSSGSSCGLLTLLLGDLSLCGFSSGDFGGFGRSGRSFIYGISLLCLSLGLGFGFLLLTFTFSFLFNLLSLESLSAFLLCLIRLGFVLSDRLLSGFGLQDEPLRLLVRLK